MLKKIAGIIIIILAALISLGLFSALFKLLTDPIKKTGNEAYDSGQVVGQWVFLVILIVIIFFLFKFGVKLMNKKTTPDEFINEIGKP